MSNRQVTYTLLLNSNVRRILEDTERQAASLDSTMSRLNSTLHAAGIGLGISEIISKTKEWVEEAANLEQAFQRIENVSSNSIQGIKNHLFINEEVDKFKLDLDKATNAFGDFLTMVRGAGLASSEIRKLHDEVLLIGKVTGLQDGQMDAAVRNLGKLLEQGTLEGRHLRPLTYQLSGLMPYISKEMGMTNQELEKMISSGKLTKSAVDSKVLLDAIEAYSTDLAPQLQKSLGLVNSEINEFDTSVLRLKEDLMMELKPELVDLIDDFTDFVGWLGQNKHGVVEFGRFLIQLGEIWLAYKIAVKGVNLILRAYRSATIYAIGETSSVTSSAAIKAGAYRSEALAVTELTAAIERLNYVQSAQNASFIAGPAGVMANTVGNRYAMSGMMSAASIRLAQMQAVSGFAGASMVAQSAQSMANMSAIAGSGTLGALSRIGSFTSGALPVAVIAIGYGVAKEIASWWNFSDDKSNATPQKRMEMDMDNALDHVKGINSIWGSLLNKLAFGHYDEASVFGKDERFLGIGSYTNYGLKDLVKEHPEILQNQEYINEVRRLLDIKGDRDLIELAQQIGFKLSSEYSPGNFGYGIQNAGISPTTIDFNRKSPYYAFLPYESEGGKNGAHSSGSGTTPKIPKSSSIKGNSVTNIHINIGELNGVKSSTFTVKNMKDYENIKEVIGVEVAQILTGAVNQSQMVGKHH